MPKDKTPTLQETDQATALPDMVKADVTGAISHLNEIADSIQEIKAIYGGLEIQGLDDAATAALVQEGYTKARNFRLEVEKRRKALIAPALGYQRAVNDAADRIKTALEEIEQPLKARLNAHDAAKAEAREVKRKAEEARMKRRAGQLFDLGSIYNGNLYQLGSAICLPDELATLPDEQWEQMVAKFTQERDILLDAKRRQEEIERQRQAEEVERLQNLRQQEAEIDQQKEELKKQTEAVHLRERAAQLKEVGFVPYFEDGKKAGMWLENHLTSRCSVQSMRSFSSKQWEEYVQDVLDFMQELALKEVEAVADTVQDNAEVNEAKLQPLPILNNATMLSELFASIRTAFEAAKTKAEFRDALAQLEADYVGAEQ